MTFVNIDENTAARKALKIGQRGATLPQAYRHIEKARDAHSRGMQRYWKERRNAKKS